MVELYGYLDPDTRDWVDGLFSNIFREMNRPTEKEVRKFFFNTLSFLSTQDTCVLCLCMCVYQWRFCRESRSSTIMGPLKKIFLDQYFYLKYAQQTFTDTLTEYS